jgi:outer membrane protein TolC
LLIVKNIIMNGKDRTSDQLSSAKRAVADARQIVERQRQRVETLRANRRDTEDAERTLHACIQALITLEAHLRSLSKSVQ